MSNWNDEIVSERAEISLQFNAQIRKVEWLQADD